MLWYGAPLWERGGDAQALPGYLTLAAIREDFQEEVTSGLSLERNKE